MSISLNCLILGDEPGLMFAIKATKTDDVDTLKELIKAKKPTRLRYTDASDLRLWKTSLSMDALRKDLQNLSTLITDYQKLFPPAEKLGFFFPDPSRKLLHVIVKLPDFPPAVTPGPSDLGTLCCLVLGDDEKDVFTVKISKSENVSLLKERIQKARAPRLDDIDAIQLRLWRVSLPIDNLATELAEMTASLSGSQLLLPTVALSTFFQSIAPDHLHVIVEKPYFSLNCFIFGNKTNGWVHVKILKTERVIILRQVIQKEAALYFKDKSVPYIDLWRVSFPIENLASRNPPMVGPPLRLEKNLSEFFPPNLETEHIHIVARPCEGISHYQVGFKRDAFCRQRAPEDPSYGGLPSMFLREQEHSDGYIACNRADRGSFALPLSLLHPVFGQFADDIEDYEPTPSDVQFFLDFSGAMARIYELEGNRQETLINVFHKHDILLEGTTIDGYTTDGDLSVGGFRFLLAKIVNEIGSEPAEPLFEASLCFLEATRDLATEHLNTTLPCIIVLMFGPYVAFAGAAWTDRPIVQMLSCAIPCHYHSADVKMENMLLRHLGAFRRAIRSLEAYYNEYTADPSLPLRNPAHPYPASFRSQNGTKKCLTYSFQMKDHNLFFGHDSDHTPVCVKFAPYYSKEGHEFLAARGFAPRLHAFERLPGGWYMIVMDDIHLDYVNLSGLLRDNGDLLKEEHREARNLLSDNIRQCLEEFHQAGFVHGDLRDTNTMVKMPNLGGFKDGTFLLVDFDYCGKVGKVRYPIKLNTASVWRPEGATGGALIMAKHDIEMLGHIWEPDPFTW